MEFVSKDEIIEGRFGKDFVTSNVAKAKNNQHKALETLAELYCTHKEISRNDPVIKDVGKLFAYRLTDVKIPHMEKNCG